MKSTMYIGIDPDVSKSGFAVWNGVSFEELTCLALWDVFKAISVFNDEYCVIVRIEAGWLSKGLNWHKSGGLRSSNDVGRNHEIGRQIEKYCIEYGIMYYLVLPQGYSSWSHDKFVLFTGWPKRSRTNTETRVAGMMVYGIKPPLNGLQGHK